jgi:sortase (surface protein transpeptidase)
LVTVAAIGIMLVTAAVLRSQAAPPRAPEFGISSASGGKDRSATPQPVRTPDRTPRTNAPDGLEESDPERIRIESIGVDATFVDLDLDDNRQLEAPEDPDQVGWFTGARSPGTPGVAVVAGHLTWNREPTVFYRLGELADGARIEITRADGSVAIFTARRRGTFPKDRFPTDEVYRATREPELTLITCGGGYDQEDHSYDSNIIVWAELTDSRPATRRGSS